MKSLPVLTLIILIGIFVWISRPVDTLAPIEQLPASRDTTETPITSDTQSEPAQEEQTPIIRDTTSESNLIPEQSSPSETQKVTSLSLTNQSLTKVPAYVFERTNLEELNISHNKLTGALQAEVRHLKNLKVLDISNNTLTGVPAEIGQLTELEVLNLSNNNITGLPYELGNLQNLMVLDLSGNNYSETDLRIIKERLPASTSIITK